MKTILVGDLHLTAQIVLPMVEQKVKELGIKRVILLGDYTDAYEQEKNVDLYVNELDYLFIWKSKMNVFGVEVISLLGNHDVSYLTVFTSKCRWISFSRSKAVEVKSANCLSVR